MPQNKFKAGLGVMFWDKKSLTLMIPICNATVLYDRDHRGFEVLALKSPNQQIFIM